MALEDVAAGVGTFGVIPGMFSESLGLIMMGRSYESFSASAGIGIFLMITLPDRIEVKSRTISAR